MSGFPSRISDKATVMLMNQFKKYIMCGKELRRPNLEQERPEIIDYFSCFGWGHIFDFKGGSCLLIQYI